jgi:hypothetical protein
VNLDIKTMETTIPITVETVISVVFVERVGCMKCKMMEFNVINNKNEAIK